MTVILIDNQNDKEFHRYEGHDIHIGLSLLNTLEHNSEVMFRFNNKNLNITLDKIYYGYTEKDINIKTYWNLSDNYILIFCTIN